MRRLRAADLAKRETAKARNDLESYIISTREKVGGGALSWQCAELSWRLLARWQFAQQLTVASCQLSLARISRIATPAACLRPPCRSRAARMWRG